jgi:hypothetical protein
MTQETYTIAPSSWIQGAWEHAGNEGPVTITFSSVNIVLGYGDDNLGEYIRSRKIATFTQTVTTDLYEVYIVMIIVPLFIRRPTAKSKT